MLLARDFIAFAGRRCAEDRCGQIAASLTFTTLLSLVPMITVAVTIAAAFPVFAEYSTAVKTFALTHMVPETAGKVITRYTQQFAENAARLTALGVAFLAVTALMLMLTIDRALNGIWRVRRQRPLVQRLLVYWAVLTVGPLLMGASISLTSWLVAESLDAVSRIPGGAATIIKTVPVLLTTAAFAVLYMAVPNRTVPLRHALAGGFAGALAFEGMKRGFAFYIAGVPTYKLIYGAFATVPLFLLWVYLSWLVVLLGAVFTASLSAWAPGRRPARDEPGHEFPQALRALHLLSEALERGRPPRPGFIADALRLSLEETESLLAVLAKAGFARRLAGGRWTLIRDPESIRVGDVYRLFVFRPPPEGSAPMADPALAALVSELESRAEEVLALSLKEVFAKPDNPGLCVSRPLPASAAAPGSP